MKKLITIALVLALALSLAACGARSVVDSIVAPPVDSAEPDDVSGADDAQEDSQVEDDPVDGGDAQGMAPLIKWMMAGTFSFDFTMTAEGPEGISENSGSMAMDGDKIAMTIETPLITVRMVKLGEKIYTIDDAHRLILEITAEDMLQGIPDDYSGITMTGSGVGEIGGRILPYEEYIVDESGASVRYFLDGGEVYGIVTEAEGAKVTMIITNAKSSVPAGVFDLPSDYISMGAIDLSGINLEDFLPEGFEMPEINLPGGFSLG